jgi:hypothetical protein
MTKPQTRLREASPPRGKQNVRFHLVREGEPIPEFAPPGIAKAKVRKQAAPPQMVMEAEPHCLLCDVVIGRFDAGIYTVTGHCGPCHEALED